MWPIDDIIYRLNHLNAHQIVDTIGLWAFIKGLASHMVQEWVGRHWAAFLKKHPISWAVWRHQRDGHPEKSPRVCEVGYCVEVPPKKAQ